MRQVPIQSEWMRRLLRLFGMDRCFRARGPDVVAVCRYCNEYRCCQQVEVWCIAAPVGTMQVVCPDCSEGFA